MMDFVALFLRGTVEENLYKQIFISSFDGSQFNDWRKSYELLDVRVFCKGQK